MDLKNYFNNEIKVSEEDCQPLRLDIYLTRKFPEFSRTYFQKLISSGAVKVDGKETFSKNLLVKGGEIISFRREILDKILKDETHGASTASGSDVKISLDIIFEDEDVIAINKQAHLVVHPACGHSDGTLVDFVEFYSKGKWKPYLVHRLDKDTSGVILISKNERSRDILTKQFKNRLVEKVYIAIVKGNVRFKKAIIDAPLGRNPKNRFITSVGEGTKVRDSYTEAEKILDGEFWSALMVKPKTGRTHQIRAHFAFIKHPILGDVLYGGNLPAAFPSINRPLLHAYSLTINHPRDGKSIKFVAPIPEDIISVAPDLKNFFSYKNNI